MVDKKSKEESIKAQGEAQVDHGPAAPDKHMETEGMIARSNPEGGAEAAEDQERDVDTRGEG